MAVFSLKYIYILKLYQSGIQQEIKIFETKANCALFWVSNASHCTAKNNDIKHSTGMSLMSADANHRIPVGEEWFMVSVVTIAQELFVFVNSSLPWFPDLHW